MKKIKEDPSFIKDDKTGAVINCDNDGYQMAKIRKEKLKEEAKLKTTITQLVERITALEKIVFDNINTKNN